MRAAAAAELSHDEVKPIQSDYHFFVKANVVRFRELAEQEVRQSLKPDQNMDPYLLNTNLNTRLKHAWEMLTVEERGAYGSMEEEDRRRFMEEDEIASRHCATLTARGKAARNEKEERQTMEMGLGSAQSRDSPDPNTMEKPTNAKMDEVDGLSEHTTNSASDDSSTTHPSSPAGDDPAESPSKKSRTEKEEK